MEIEKVEIRKVEKRQIHRRTLVMFRLAELYDLIKENPQAAQDLAHAKSMAAWIRTRVRESYAT